MIKDRNIDQNAAISLSKLASGTLPAGIVLSSANIPEDAVITADVADGAVTLAKLASGITPSHVIKFVALGSTITTTALA